ncbi:MAG: PucR family transcriptional regulator ligand-binding domain-containing protein [Lachnospiraceae bacterium]|nr:PucR family transcriptional regulator ligand-binding domain-containing protein [Lachnospiraceae bacterium]
MLLTLRWLLEQNHESESFTCLAGKQGIDRPITGINIMDNPDTVPWLKQNELILSTGYIFSSTDIYKTIIRSLHEKDCCGLGIKMNRYMDVLPSEMIEQADELGFPIFSIPFSSTMEQIVNLVYRQMFSNEMSESERMMTLYKNITEAALKRHSILPVLESISAAVKTPVFLTNAGFELLEYYIPGNQDLSFPFSYSKDSDSLFSQVDSIFLQNEYRNNPLPVRKHTVSFDKQIHTYILFAIIYQKSLLGYLICMEGDQPFSSFEYELISNLHSVLCITFIKNTIQTEGQQIDRTSFFNELLSGTLKTDQEIEPLCHRYDFDFLSPRICAAIHIDHYHEMSIARQKPFLRKIIASMRQVLTENHIEFTYTIHDSNLVVFLFLQEIDSSRRMETACTCITGIIRHFHAEAIYLTAGLSCCMSHASTIFTCYIQSIRALELGKKLHPQDICFCYSEDRIYHILSSAFTTSQLLELYTNILKPLDDFDMKNDSNLSETLHQYFQNGMNIAKTAKTLYIHRNTMIYRMEQIQEIINFNSKNADDIYLLQTAFYIKKLLFL